ncbi:MAG: DUF998 domain-containing protein [Dermatophilaceae bacterium]
MAVRRTVWPCDECHGGPWSHPSPHRFCSSVDGASPQPRSRCPLTPSYARSASSPRATPPTRWLMTSALVGVGLSHVVTAFALRPVAAPGRLVQGLGGLATVLVAVFPLPSGGGSSPAHTAAATVSFVSLALWPAFAWIRPRLPGQAFETILGPRVSAAATGTLLLTLAWFFDELLVSGQRVGLAERVAAGTQAVWPLVVVLSVRRAQGLVQPDVVDPRQS